MRRGLAIGLLIGWLIGIGTGLLGLAVTGGWYEYQAVATRVDAFLTINEGGWELVRGPEPSGLYVLRRPRIRLR